MILNVKEREADKLCKFYHETLGDKAVKLVNVLDTNPVNSKPVKT